MAASKRHLGCWIDGAALQGCEAVLNISIKKYQYAGTTTSVGTQCTIFTLNMTKTIGGSVLDGSARDVLGWLGWLGSGWLGMSGWLGRLGTARRGSANLQNLMGSKHSLVALYGVAGCVRQCFRPGETLKNLMGSQPVNIIGHIGVG